jgi:glycosyltransferase involved in cell wall biosynthesis
VATRVLVLNERDPRHPRAGGAEVHVEEIARRLARMGFESTLAAVSFPGAPAREAGDGFEIWRLGPLPAYYARAAFFCARETRRGRFDVVVEHLCKLPFCASWYSAVPVVAVSHHLFGTTAFRQVAWPIALGVVAAERLIPRAYRGLELAAVSESSRADLIARGLPAERIRIVPNGIRWPELEPPPWAERPLRVAYLGRLEPYKRIERLLRAVATLVPRLPALELVIIGRGRARPSLEREARALGIADRTRFTGFVSDAERDRLVSASRLAACPSEKEGWGLTVIEANALGTPVVATDAPGLRDAVQHDTTGLLVPDGPTDAFCARLAQAIARVLEDEGLGVRLSACARGWARRFDWDRSAELTARLIQDALARG